MDAPLMAEHLFLGHFFACFVFFYYFCINNHINVIMKQALSIVLLAGMVVLLAACGGKKKSEDIIAPRIVKIQPKDPIRMQAYLDEKKVGWIGKTYFVKISREPSDSLSIVKDDTGQKYIDNVFTLTVSRQDGSVFFSRKFTKQSVAQYLDDEFNQTGVFEGMVFDRAEGDWLVFGASVGHPQSDEYIPLIIRLSRMGDLDIKRDTEMDSAPEDKV